MVEAFSMLFAKIAAAIKWVGDLFVAVFTALWHMVTDLVSWAFDGLLGVTIEALADVDTSGFSAYSNAWMELPAEVLNVLRLVGAGEAIAIITAALGIRLVLQLIPFVRLGS